MKIDRWIVSFPILNPFYIVSVQSANGVAR